MIERAAGGRGERDDTWVSPRAIRADARRLLSETRGKRATTAHQAAVAGVGRRQQHMRDRSVWTLALRRRGRCREIDSQRAADNRLDP